MLRFTRITCVAAPFNCCLACRMLRSLKGFSFFLFFFLCFSLFLSVCLSLSLCLCLALPLPLSIFVSVFLFVSYFLSRIFQSLPGVPYIQELDRFVLFFFSVFFFSLSFSLGCNNGGGGGNFSQVKQLVAKWIGTRKRLSSVFLAPMPGFKKCRNFFSRHILPINPYMHLPLFTGS